MLAIIKSIWNNLLTLDIIVWALNSMAILDEISGNISFMGIICVPIKKG